MEYKIAQVKSNNNNKPYKLKNKVDQILGAKLSVR